MSDYWGTTSSNIKAKWYTAANGIFGTSLNYLKGNIVYISLWWFQLQIESVPDAIVDSYKNLNLESGIMFVKNNRFFVKISR